MLNYYEICTAHKNLNKSRGIPFQEYLDKLSQYSRNRTDVFLLSGDIEDRGQQNMNISDAVDALYDFSITKVLNGLDPSGNMHKLLLLSFSKLYAPIYEGGTTYPPSKIDEYCNMLFAEAVSLSSGMKYASGLVELWRINAIRSVQEYCKKGNGVGYIRFRYLVKQGILDAMAPFADNMSRYDVAYQAQEVSIKSGVSHPVNSLKWFCYVHDIRDRKILKFIDEDTDVDLYNLLWVAKESGDNPVLTVAQVDRLVEIIKDIK